MLQTLDGNYAITIDDEIIVYRKVSKNEEYYTCRNPPFKYRKPLEYTIDSEDIFRKIRSMIYVKEKTKKIILFKTLLSDILRGLIRFNCAEIIIDDNKYSTNYIFICIAISFLFLEIDYYDGFLMSGYEYFCKTLALSILEESYHNDLDELYQLITCRDVNNICRWIKLGIVCMTCSTRKFFPHPDKIGPYEPMMKIYNELKTIHDKCQFIESLCYNENSVAPSRPVKFTEMNIANCVFSTDAKFFEYLNGEDTPFIDIQMFDQNPRNELVNCTKVPLLYGQVLLYEHVSGSKRIREKWKFDDSYLPDLLDTPELCHQFYYRMKNGIKPKPFCDMDAFVFGVCIKLVKFGILKYYTDSRFKILDQEQFDVVFKYAEDNKSERFKYVITHDNTSISDKICSGNNVINLELIEATPRNLSKLAKASVKFPEGICVNSVSIIDAILRIRISVSQRSI